MTEGNDGRARAGLVRTIAPLRIVPRWLWVASGALVCLVIGTWALGGLDTVEGATPTEWAAGDPHDHGQVIATIHDYTVTTETGQPLPEGATARLVVRATVVGDDEETLDYPRDIVELPPGLALTDGEDPQPEATHQVDLGDGRRHPLVHPDLPIEIAFLWPLADAADVPTDGLDVEALETAWVFSPSSNAWHWGTSEPVADMTIPYTPEVPDVLRGGD